MQNTFAQAKKHIKRVVVAIAGVTVILIAFALFFLPGPGIVVLLIGLAILATEYEFARIWLKKVKQKYDDGKNFVTNKNR